VFQEFQVYNLNMTLPNNQWVALNVTLSEPEYWGKDDAVLYRF
jgi:hypothetical protein